MQVVNLEERRPDAGTVTGPPEPTTRRFISIRIIVVAVAMAITTAAVVSVGTVAERNTRRALTEESEARLMLEARNLAMASTGALLSDFPELTLHPLTKEMKNRNPELTFVTVVDHTNTVQGHEDSRLLGTPFTPPADLSPIQTLRNFDDDETMMANASTLVASTHVLSLTGDKLGTVYVGMSREYINEIISSARRAQLLVLGLVLVLAVVASLVLMTYLLRPIGTLRKGLARIGRGDLDTPLQMHDRTELGLLADAVNDMASRLRTAQDEMVEKERMVKELELGRDIQRSLLPREAVEHGGFRVNGSQRAAAEVGGDYFDYFTLPDGKVGLAVADVAGKGLGGCLVMSMLSALLRAYKDSHRSPTDLLIRIDERLSERMRAGTFVTMWYGILDPGSGNLVYSSAGHSPTLIYRAGAGKVERRDTRGIPLGAIRGGAIRATLQDEEVRLDTGDVLLQYTDGLNESFEPTGKEQFDFHRMEQVLSQHAGSGADGVLSEMRSALESWIADGEQLDDETLLVVSREIEEAVETHDPAETMECLQQARDRGVLLELDATLPALDRIPAWTGKLAELSGIDPLTRKAVDTALYETCANIAEHGYGLDAEKQMQVWWLSAPDSSPDNPRGFFVLQDHGRPFRLKSWKATDFSDRQTWRRGRGFGLDIIHRTMLQVLYGPSTEEGNITVLVFDPTKLEEMKKELRYA